MSQEIIGIQESSRRMTLRDLLYILFRHKWKGFLFFLVTVSCATAMVFFCARNIYRSEAQLLVEMAGESLSTSGGRQQAAELQAELNILQGRQIVERVVDALGAAAFQKASIRPRIVPTWLRLPDPQGEPNSTPTRDEAIRHLSRSVTLATGGRNGNRIDLGYEAPDANFAQQVLATFLEAYFEEHALADRSITTHQFFAEQVNRMKTELTQMESELHELKASAGISDYVVELQIKLAHIGLIKQQMQTARSDRAGSAARIEALAKKLAHLPETVLTSATTGLPNAAADEMRSRLYELQLFEQEYLTKYNEGSRQVTDIRQRIEAAMELLAGEESTRTQITHGISRTRQSVERTIVAAEATESSLEAKMAALAQSLKDAEADVKRVNEASVHIKRLEREIQIREAHYLKYADSLEQARIKRALNPDMVASVNILQPATLSVHAAKPNKARVIALSALLGLVGSIAVAFLWESADHAIKTPQGARKSLQLPTLVSVPRTPSNTIAATRRRRGGEAGPGVEWDVPHEVRDRFEQLSDQLVKGSKSPSARKHVVGITSSLKGEGVSVVAANVAALLAGNKRVLLIDTNVEHPSLPDIFDMKVTLGLLDVISNRRKRRLAIWNSPVENLDVMPVGTHNNGRHDLSLDDTRKLINLLKKDYDCIVLDLPAVNEAGYSARLASLCDNVSLIVDAEHSRREVVKQALKKLAQLNTNVLGVVLNKRRFPIPEWIYRALS